MPIIKQSLLDFLETGRRMGRGSTPGPMGQHLRDSLWMIIYMGKERLYGLIIDNTMVNEKTTKCMAKAHIPGMTENSTKENITKIENTAMGNSHGRMEGSIRGIGKMGSKMEEGLSRKRGRKKGKAFGKMAVW